MQLLPGWDKELIQMLNNCEAGEKAIITGNSTYYIENEGLLLFEDDILQATAMDYWNEETNLPVFTSRSIN